jgi:RNA polymerase sigma factor (sigma-70 family)
MTEPEPGDLRDEALEALVSRSAEQVRRLAARYGLEDRVDEVFQEVRIRLWRSGAGHGNLAEAPASYVYRTALSAAVDLLRRRRARRETPAKLERPSGEAVFGEAPPADASFEDRELGDLIEQEIDALAPDRAMVVRLHLAGYSREEIADLLSWTEPRTRHLIYRGLADLRERLRARGIGPEGPA